MAKKEEVKEVKQEPKKPAYTVEVTFRDISDFDKVYNAGEDVSHLEEERLKNLLSSGYVKKTN